MFGVVLAKYVHYVILQLISFAVVRLILFIDGETLLSQEGTTQGDPLAMAMYAIAVNPLIHRLKQDTTKVCRRCHCWGKAQQLARMVGLPHQYWSRVRLLPECIKNMAHCEGRIQG